MYIFDTHAHYDDERFDRDRKEVLKMVREQGVGRIVNVGTSLALGSIQKTIAMTEEYEFVYGAAGIHPEYVMELENKEYYAKLENCLQNLEKSVWIITMRIIRQENCRKSILKDSLNWQKGLKCQSFCIQGMLRKIR